MIAIGIDIGLTGAIAFVSHSARCVVVDMPTKLDDRENRRVDGRALLTIFRQHAPAGEPLLVGLEDVRARVNGNSHGATNTMQSQGSLLRTRGAVEAVLDALGLTPTSITPQTWKAHYGLKGIGKNAATLFKAQQAKKEAALEVARALYPGAELHLKKHHNRAEAVLIAHYLLADEGVIE